VNILHLAFSLPAWAASESAANADAGRAKMKTELAAMDASQFRWEFSVIEDLRAQI
jgi:hypothetical protein